jgi:hypothetical protein
MILAMITPRWIAPRQLVPGSYVNDYAGVGGLNVYIHRNSSSNLLIGLADFRHFT